MRDRLHLDSTVGVSVFAGDPGLRLGEDEVAHQSLEAVGQPRERIVGLPRTETSGRRVRPGRAGLPEMYYDAGGLSWAA